MILCSIETPIDSGIDFIVSDNVYYQKFIANELVIVEVIYNDTRAQQDPFPWQPGFYQWVLVTEI